MPRYALQNITPSNGSAPSPATISAAATTAGGSGVPTVGMMAAGAAAGAPVMSSVHGAPVVAGNPMFMQAGGMPPRMMGGPPGPPPQFAAMGMPHAMHAGFGRPPMTNPGKKTNIYSILLFFDFPQEAENKSRGRVSFFF